MRQLEIGIDLGGTKTALAAFHGSALLARASYATAQTQSAAQLAATLAERAAALAAQAGGAVAGVGVGTPSDVDVARGVIRSSTNIPQLASFDLRRAMRARFGAIPVQVDNDANAAALAEARHGAGRGARNMLYSAISTGIGGGLVLDGRLFRGDRDHAGEIGHMVVTPGQGVRCGCGNQGCFESYCGGAHLHQRVLARVAAGEKTVMLEWSGAAPITGELWKRAWEAGDTIAAALLDESGYYLGLLYYNLYQVLNIERIVLGGGLTAFGEPLFTRIRASFRSFTGENSSRVSFVPAALGADAGVIGARELLHEADGGAGVQTGNSSI